MTDHRDIPDAPTVVGASVRPRERSAGSRISLLIYHHTGTRVVSLAEGQPIVVGRDHLAEITLNDPALSRRHASFEVVGGLVWVEDLGSTNGTRVNGEPITRARLGVGDEATFGEAVASIHVLPDADLRQRGLDSHDHFLRLLEHEVVRGRVFGRPLALLMLHGEGLAARIDPIRELLRPVDRLALYSEDVLEILQPEGAAEPARQLASQVQATLRDGGCLAAAAAAVFPEAGTSPVALLNACREALHGARVSQPAVLAGTGPRSWEPEVDGAQPGLVVRSDVMREIFETIERLSRSVIPVLLVGDTGTGKEVLARLIHQGGPRKGRRMVSVNCGAIPTTLVESVLFGHEKGAFTGATQSQRGLFEEADGGTLLLDEVGELSPSAQAALLRVLETKQLTRVGSNRVVSVDVRVMAATNRDLEAMFEHGGFRRDLYYRLNAMTLRIPPLRDRPEEIAPLAELFVREANRANGRSVTAIDAEAMRLLHAYGWPGNVRELRNTIERAVVIARSDRVGVQDLPQCVRDCAAPTGQGAPRQKVVDAPPAAVSEAPEPEVEAPAGEEALDYRQQMQRQEARVILNALREAKWNRAKASQLLNIPLRTLSHKIRQLGIKRQGYEIDEE